MGQVRTTAYEVVRMFGSNNVSEETIYELDDGRVLILGPRGGGVQLYESFEAYALFCGETLTGCDKGEVVYFPQSTIDRAQKNTLRLKLTLITR